MLRFLNFFFLVANELRGKLGEVAYLEDWITTITPIVNGEATFNVTFDWDEEELGIPCAFFIRNDHHNEFYLKSLTLEDVPGYGRVFFLCNSWVYPFRNYKKDRIFFVNQVEFFYFLFFFLYFALLRSVENNKRV